jgi:hypothetical protein
LAQCDLNAIYVAEWLLDHPDALDGSARARLLERLEPEAEAIAAYAKDVGWYASCVAAREQSPSPAALLEPLAAAHLAVRLSRYGSDEHAPILFRRLLLLARRLSQVGRWQEALVPVDEVVTLCRRPAGVSPAACRARLAEALADRSYYMAAAGRKQEALAPIVAAVALYRQLYSAHPNDYRCHLVNALYCLSDRMSDLGRATEARAALVEAVEFEWQHYWRDALQSRHYKMLRALKLSNRLCDSGRGPEALAVLKDATELRRRWLHLELEQSG